MLKCLYRILGSQFPHIHANPTKSNTEEAVVKLRESHNEATAERQTMDSRDLSRTLLSSYTAIVWPLAKKLSQWIWKRINKKVSLFHGCLICLLCLRISCLTKVRVMTCTAFIVIYSYFVLIIFHVSISIGLLVFRDINALILYSHLLPNSFWILSFIVYKLTLSCFFLFSSK